MVAPRNVNAACPVAEVEAHPDQDMAPRTDKRNAAKAKAGKPRAKEKAASVRRDKTKTADGTPPEVNTDEACPSAATGSAKEANLGAFEAPRLLTALKYQIVSKKSTPQPQGSSTEAFR